MATPFIAGNDNVIDDGPGVSVETTFIVNNDRHHTHYKVI